VIRPVPDAAGAGPGDDLHVSAAWRRWRATVDLDDYDTRWDRLEAQGHRVHDEADLVEDLLADSGGDVVLDAGCGAGRVAVELARRGRRVLGADNDADMLALARRKPEPVRWILADLASIALDDPVDVVVLAGNVLPFVVPELRPAVMANLARQLRPGGLLVAGAGLGAGCGREDTERWAAAAGLVLHAEYATWDRAPFEGGVHRVSVHRRPG